MKVRKGWTRERIKRHLVQRFYVRFHMTLILASASLAAMLGNWFMLHALGMHGMWVRYPLAVAVAYLTFLASVALWLRYVGVVRRPLEPGSAPDGNDGIAAAAAIEEREERRAEALAGGATAMAWGQPLQPIAADAKSDLAGRRRQSSDGSFSIDGIDLSSDAGTPSLEVFKGGGGTTGGGGASGSWGDPPHLHSMVTDGGSGGGGSSFSLGDIGDLDFDGIVLLLLALALIAAVFFVSGYVIWFAPDILSEAVFGATLAAGLSRTARRNDSEGWVAGVVRKTWWPFAIVLILAEAFAVFAAIHYPAAATLGQAVAAALSDPG